LLGLLILAGIWFFWPSGSHPSAQKNKIAPQPAVVALGFTSTRSASTAPVLFAGKTATNSVARTNQFAWRLNNTSKSIGQLMNDPHAILLANALIDIGRPLNFSIPKNLQSPGDPGAYIVQARGPVDNAFRATLAAAGAQIVSYIPNNAYLVRISSGGAAGLSGQPPVQSVIPYEPYYKISSALIGAAVQQKNLPDDSALTLGLFADNAQATIDQIKQLGGTVVGTDRSPFGPIVRVIPPANWTALATLPGVQIVELAHRRAMANDLSRVTLGISTDTITPTNYMNLSGQNVIVEVNDTGIDAAHPDFSAGRVTGLPSSLVDTNGHGTHVAGIIAGNGLESSTINTTNTPQGSVTNADFRGKAPLASLYSFAALDNAGNLDISDEILQAVPATNNALISNNSWAYDDDTYDLASASYDAAVRDALPLVTGSQPVLFVFAAGNDGGGDDSGGGGLPDTILSPGTAKDVITVGALEQLRDITNIVTDAAGNSNAVWQAATDSGNEVAGYSSRGNVGIGTEGTFGRFKPDVVAPGSFVVSTRSAQWDTNAYYNPTNVTFNEFFQQSVQPNTLVYYPITVPANAVEVDILIVPNSSSSSPFPTNLPIYVAANGFPTTTVNDGVTFKNEFDIPADAPGFLQTVQNGGFNFAVGNTNSNPVNYDIITEITTTNDLGNYFQVLEGLNETLAPFYRYESGTSMATPAVSGTLALMQDYFTNNLHTTPSPALLKALVINGSRSQGSYEFSVTNIINSQGWGLPSLPAILPFGLTNQAGAACSSFFLDQSPTNSLATGQSQTFMVSIPDFTTQIFPLRVTLAWTDPPGNPAAAIKLVNSLELVVTNLDILDPNYGSVYFGNDLDGGTNSAAWDTNATPNIDLVNNVQNVFLPALLGQTYSVTVIGRSVNVNAVTAQINNAAGVYAPNVVQDYALVISSGDGEVTNGITVVQEPPPNPFVSTQVTFVASTNTLLMNQLAGGNTPLLGTNTVGAGAGYITNAAITVGMTNQWHFYVVTNTLGFTNAAFITFLSQTLATPRMGVFADDSQNPTQPEADIDLYVATEPGLTNLDTNVIANCVNGLNGDGASLANGTGTEFVAYTNSLAGNVYYIGVKSETQEAAVYDFLPVFSQIPFSETDQNGNEIVNGLLLPVNIPDGSPAHPGTAYVFALAVQPIEAQDIIITNTFLSQNFGDLVGVLNHGGKNVVLNNHNSPPPTISPDIFDFVYDDSPQPIIGSQPPDGPGSLNDFQGQQGIGPWILTEVDNSLTQTSSVTAFTLFIQPHIDLTGGASVTIPGQGFFYGFIDVPAGATNLTIAATNTTLPSPDAFNPGQLFEKLGEQPAPPPTPPTNFDKMVTLNNGVPPGGVITVGPSDIPPIQPGRYFVTLYNPSFSPQTYFVIASIGLGQVAPVDFTAAGPLPLLDDAVMYSSVFVTNTLPIATIGVGLRVDHPRISDLVFHLISPDGTRYLLMENRGADSTEGCGVTILTTNIVNVASAGGSGASTNYINVGENSGTLTINYDFFTIPDEMTVYASTNATDFSIGNAILDTGVINGTGQLSIPFTTASGYLTIIMNQFSTNGASSDQWTYTAGGVQTNFYYLDLTQDTNLTTTPIKFAPPPFVPTAVTNFVVHTDIVLATNFIPVMTNSLSGFEGVLAGDYFASLPIPVDGWNVISNQVTVVTDPTNAAAGSNFLALANGSIGRTLTTVPGVTNILTFADRGPGIISWWRGENNTLDSLVINNGSPIGPVSYATGEVGQAFSFNGVSSYVQMANSPSLNPAGAFSIEGWIYLTNDVPQAMILSKWGDSGGYANNRSYVLSTVSGLGLLFSISDLANQGNNGFQQISVDGVLTLNAWNHVAATYDSATGIRHIYANGVNVLSHTNAPVDVYNSITPVTIGAWLRGPGEIEGYFPGLIDEVSLYNRALSDSEVNAIYSNGTNGKFNPFQFSTSPAQSLAEAGITIPGFTTNSIFGNNPGWQTNTIAFVPNSTTTPVTIAGLEPGMLLDAFTTIIYSNQIYTVTNLVTNAVVAVSNLYYMPEQSLDPLIGTSAFGTWQLEIQDDRVGATNQTVLDSWQLQIVFANTNPVPALSIPAGGFVWYPVDVPTNADFATNILTFATGPLNMWFSTNAPPTIVNPGDVEFLTGQTAGSETLSTNGSPINTTSAYMVPGGTYYIGIQNLGAVAVQYGFEVNFHLILPNVTNPYAFTQPAQAVTGTSAQLNGMATPNGAPAMAWFEWGTNTLYGNLTAPVSVGAGSNVVYAAALISSLVPNLPYHFRLVVSNAQTVVYGFDQILDEATVVVWGADFAGQATVPAGLSNVVSIAGAYNHSLALKNDETAVGWGDNFFGQATVPPGLNSSLVALAGGETYSVALRNSGTVVTWGANTFPGETNIPAGLNNVVLIASGDYSSLALRSDGSVVAWGANIFGLTNVPATLSNVVSIAGGSLHNLALKYDGTVVVWGDDSLGQTNVPSGLTNVVAIAGGNAHSLALRSDGTVVAWGDDGDGQTDVPPGLNNVVAIAAGAFNSLALKNDGSVVAWGDNSSGQSSVPVGLSNVVAIAAGYLHSMALTPFFNVNPVNPIVLDLTNGVPQTNNIFPGGIIYYKINVPTNADFATNILFALNPNQSLNLWFTTHTPPTITNVNDSLLLAAATNGLSVLSTSSAPTNIVPGSIYYLGVQNTNAFSVTYGIGVDFHLVTSTNPPPPNAIPIFSIIHTNGGFLLTWFAPSNDLFQVQWTTGLAPSSWTPFTNIISYNTSFPASPTNAQFNFFDDGSQTGGFGPTRFYRLILLGSGPSANTPPVLPSQVTQTVNPLNPLVVTNTATDADLPPQTLTYTLTSTVTGTNVPTINTNTGVITWTPDLSQAGTSNLITTIVTDNGVPPLSATNSFSVIVNPVPGISSVTFTGSGYLLTWFAPTNDIFQVQVATNLALPTVWLTIATNITYTGPLTPTNGLFTYFDDGSQVPFGGLRFYRLNLIGIVPPATTTVPIGSIISTNGGFLLTWLAPTNDQFNVRWATNLALPVNWTLFPGTVTSTNNVFSFMDTNAPLLMKFYDLLLLP
jgi:subtilisin-like proprotein convertase family protein